MTVIRKRRPLEIWPAFVDATASLLLVVVFVLLIAAVGQLYLTNALFGRDEALMKLNARVVELADMLSMQKSESAELSELLNLRTASLARAEETIREQHDVLAGTREKLATREATLAEQERELAARNRTLARIETEVAALRALRDRLQADVEAVIGERDDVRARLEAEIGINVAARAQLELLNQQLAQLGQQLSSLNHALEVAAAEIELKGASIEDLGQRLNVALANKAQQLQRYRSEFFGRLRDALAEHPEVRVEGDRFVLPSSLLFETASDELGVAGVGQVAQLANTLNTLAGMIPDDVDWIVRIDGHTDRRSIASERFPSNWELSAARAIAIVRALIRYGVPERRLAATGFGEFHPIDAGQSEMAYARNRRIEIKLTSR